MVLADYRELCGVVEHVDQAFGSEEALADQKGLGGIPERVFVLG